MRAQIANGIPGIAAQLFAKGKAINGDISGEAWSLVTAEIEPADVGRSAGEFFNK
jgi:hypothetical protein